MQQWGQPYLNEIKFVSHNMKISTIKTEGMKFMAKYVQR